MSECLILKGNTCSNFPLQNQGKFTGTSERSWKTQWGKAGESKRVSVLAARVAQRGKRSNPKLVLLRKYAIS
jgi:hypothetical protein